jgi:hypothetical protein
MNIFDKIKVFCRKFRIALGVVLIAVGLYTNNFEMVWSWFYLGIIPLIAGLANFCPLCIISKKCSDGSCDDGKCDSDKK